VGPLVGVHTHKNTQTTNGEGSNYDARTSLPDDGEKRLLLSYDGSNSDERRQRVQVWLK
jgi:hypothetical protein